MAPEPVSKNVVCSDCGQPWDKHIDGRAKTTKITASDCVRVLNAEVKRLSAYPRQFLGTTNSAPGYSISNVNLGSGYTPPARGSIQ